MTRFRPSGLMHLLHVTMISFPHESRLARLFEILNKEQNVHICVNIKMQDTQNDMKSISHAKTFGNRQEADIELREAE